MTRFGPGSTYTRGWETVGHYLLMLRASVKMHLAFSLLGGLLLGSCWFYSGLDSPAKGNLGQYLKASVLSLVSSEKKAQFDLGDGPNEQPIESAQLYFRHHVFGGRTPGFLFRQWTFHVLASMSVFLVLFALFVSRHGKRMSKDKRRRGARIEDASNLKRKTSNSSIRLSLAIGLLLASSLFFSMLGGEGRRNFGSYFWSSLYVSFEPLSYLASPDDSNITAWYYEPQPQGFRSNQEMYSWFKEQVYGSRSPAILLSAWLAMFGLLTFTSYLVLSRLKKSSGGSRRELSLARIPIPEGSECTHFLFSGSPGSGKSTAIKEVLDQVRGRGQRAIIFDASGEYIEPYFREGKDIILNPIDSRSRSWNLWEEVREPTDYLTIARSLFPAGGKDPFWNDAGAALFAATAETMAKEGNPNNSRIHQLLSTGSIEDLATYLDGTSATKFLDQRAGAMPSNLIATVTTRITAWSLLAELDGKGAPFSIRSFIENEETDSWLFLAMRQDHQASLRPLVSLWCDLAATSILSLPPSRSRRIWVVLDEVASLQRLPALPPLLERGRKHGGAVLLGLQSMPQLRDSYGHDAAAALASQPQTWLVLRTVEPDTARWLEHALGEQELDETRESVSMGADSLRDGVSLQQNILKRSVAMATEIMSLPDLGGYLKLPGNQPIFRVKLEVKNRDIKAPIFLPRKQKTIKEQSK